MATLLAKMADPPLTQDERKVLNVLMEHGRRVAERTTEAIASAIGAEHEATYRVLRGLEKRRPQLARPDVDATLDIRFWHSTYEAADAVEGDES